MRPARTPVQRRIRARAVATNTPPNGRSALRPRPSRCRGELMVEHVAERLGVSSVELRRQWMLRLGDHHGDGQKLTEAWARSLYWMPLSMRAPSFQRSNIPRSDGAGPLLVFHGPAHGKRRKETQRQPWRSRRWRRDVPDPHGVPTEIDRGRKPSFVSLLRMHWVSVGQGVLAPQDT